MSYKYFLLFTNNFKLSFKNPLPKNKLIPSYFIQ